MASNVLPFMPRKVGSQVPSQAFSFVPKCLLRKAGESVVSHLPAKAKVDQGKKVVTFVPVQVLTDLREQVLSLFPSLAQPVNHDTDGTGCHHLTDDAGQVPDAILYASCRPFVGPLETILAACACYHAQGIATGWSRLSKGQWQLTPRGYRL